MKYFREKPLGFDKDEIAMINLPSDSSLRVKYPMLISRMKQIPGVTSAGLCYEAPATSGHGTISLPITMKPSFRILISRRSLAILPITRLLEYNC